MRLIIIILLFTSKAFATDYYVSNAGSDGAAGTIGAPWATLTKISNYSISPGFLPGDNIFLNRGNIWNDSLRFYSSGSVANPITIAAYGSGVKPEITGFQNLSMTNIGGNIWTGTATNSVANQNTVLVNGIIRYKARFPNSTVFNYVSIISARTKLVVPHSVTNYTGKEIVIRGASWETDVAKIVSQNNGITNDTFNLNRAISYGGNLGANGYFFQNHQDYIDTLNEYSYDSASKLISVRATSLPLVRYSVIDTLVRVRNKQYITFLNITFSGSNVFGFNIDSTKGFSITNCTFKNLGLYAVFSGSSNGFTVSNDSLLDILSNGIWGNIDTFFTFNNNFIKNIGIYQGMGKGGVVASYTGVVNVGDYFTITGNTFKNVGYNAIHWRGRFGLIKNNFIDSACFTKNDGAGIYTFCILGFSNADSGSIIRANIIQNSGGVLPGDTYTVTAGIYLDDNCQSIVVDSNTISGMPTYGVFTKGARHRISYNLIKGDGQNINYFRYQINTKDTITNNLIYVSNASGYAMNLSTANDSLATIDNNHYIMPLDSSKVMLVNTTRYLLSAFKAAFPLFEQNSVATLPYGITSTIPVLFTNPTLVDSTVVLSQGYYNAKGIGYIGSVVLKPFGSLLLFPSVFISSAITPVLNLKFSQINKL